MRRDMPCECVICSECGGSGRVWFSFPGPGREGKYLGNHRCDDLDEMDTCSICGGSGVSEVCHECQCQYNDEEDEL